MDINLSASNEPVDGSSDNLHVSNSANVDMNNLAGNESPADDKNRK